MQRSRERKKLRNARLKIFHAICALKNKQTYSKKKILSRVIFFSLVIFANLYGKFCYYRELLISYNVCFVSI